jgi:hypothetical protein
VKEASVSENIEISLRDGTFVRHKSRGYEGRIEGTTAIKACFTRGGVTPDASAAKEAFQYRIVVSGETTRHIAPPEDLEILEAAAAVQCIRCQKNFVSKPGVTGKAYGRCACGGWICPACLGCQSEEASKSKATACINQRKRFVRKLTNGKK